MTPHFFAASKPHKQPLLLRKLDGRLQHLYEWATARHYTHIWDLCCDHGRLGLHLHQATQQAQSHIYLIDQVPSIINRLQKQCTSHSKNRLTISCLDASKISLAAGSHCIILAGIGGKNAVEIIKALLANHLKPQAQATRAIHIDVLLSPTNHTYALREYLHTTPLEVVDEAFIHEKGHDYEHMFYRLNLLATQNSCKKHNPAGSSIWQPMTSTKKRYLHKLIQYHQTCQLKHTSQSSPSTASHASYQALVDYQNALARNESLSKTRVF
ncbi:SAM-dependent methyltransferase [Marinagarivorans algicola]|uniref:SAM-dependent methyltransferase n=1 Tax=Marinagarivorans algicola TaxID=1513270 RepID=UPI0006B4EF6E|nr:SAM-dependent methyltransferase [Marinagarivorans algicola]